MKIMPVGACNVVYTKVIHLGEKNAKSPLLNQSSCYFPAIPDPGQKRKKNKEMKNEIK